ncbi:MAG: hypothetical protein RR346_03750 [Bacteroidales bacterium]
MRTLHQVVLCRSEEIIENISNQLKIAGYDSKQLSVGFILTGGASNMKGLTSLLRKKTDMEVKFGTFQKTLSSPQFAEAGKDISYSVLLGMLQKGSLNCCKEEEPAPVMPEPEPVKAPEPPKKKDTFQKFGGFLVDIFKDDKDTKLD